MEIKWAEIGLSTLGFFFGFFYVFFCFFFHDFAEKRLNGRVGRAIYRRQNLEKAKVVRRLRLTVAESSGLRVQNQRAEMTGY